MTLSDGRGAVINLDRFVLKDIDLGVIELHPLPLTFDQGVVVAVQHATARMHDYTFQVIGGGDTFSRLEPHFFWVGDPEGKLLVLEGPRINLESLQVQQEQLWILANGDLFRCNLLRIAMLTLKLVPLVQ